MKSYTCKKGDILFVRGQKPTGIIVIKQGELALFSEKENNILPYKKILSREMIGEGELFTERPHQYTGIVFSPTLEYITVSYSDVHESFKQCQPLVRSLLLLLTERHEESTLLLAQNKIVKEDMAHSFQLEAEDKNNFWQSLITYRRRKNLL